MAIQHKDIPDSGRHEPKGASTAVSGTVLTSNGDGSTSWKKSDVGVIVKELALEAISPLASQEPTGLGDAGKIRISLGAAQDQPYISIDATGLMTIKEDGYYDLELSGRFGRTAGAGVAVITARMVAGGVPSNTPTSYSLDDGDFTIPYATTVTRYFPAGTELYFEIMREGVDNGGLFSYTGAWGTAPCAEISIYKLGIQPS